MGRSERVEGGERVTQGKSHGTTDAVSRPVVGAVGIEL